jgi:5,10-methylenetetrahydrofolate reductase
MLHPDDIGPTPWAPLRPLPGHVSRGRLERVLRRGEFAVTTEINPPDSADPDEIEHRIKPFEGWVDAINATDGSGAHCHMSSIAVSALLIRMGYSPITQIACRDHNRIAIQGNVLGAAALGVANILCLTGDGVQAGDHPQAKPVFDLDSISLLDTIRVMRDEGRFLSGRKITGPPQVFVGAAENPFAQPYALRPLRLARKIAAGAQFIQTQYCYDMTLMRGFMARVRDLGLDRRCFILAGVGPLASARAAKWILANVPGVHIPDAVIARLEGARHQRAEGQRICVELIQQLRVLPGIAGVHVMAYKQEESIAEIVHDSGVLSGRTPWRRDLVATLQAVETQGAA